MSRSGRSIAGAIRTTLWRPSVFVMLATVAPPVSAISMTPKTSSWRPNVIGLMRPMTGGRPSQNRRRCGHLETAGRRGGHGGHCPARWRRRPRRTSSAAAGAGPAACRARGRRRHGACSRRSPCADGSSSARPRRSSSQHGRAPRTSDRRRRGARPSRSTARSSRAASLRRRKLSTNSRGSSMPLDLDVRRSRRLIRAVWHGCAAANAPGAQRAQRLRCSNAAASASKNMRRLRFVRDARRRRVETKNDRAIRGPCSSRQPHDIVVVDVWRET